METQTKQGAGAKDFIINLGAIVALYTLVGSLLSLLFTVINTAYPQVNSYSYFGGSATISWPVATLIIFSPIFILLMWLLGREYDREPEKKNQGIHKWLTYITLFITGLTMAVDLITVVYYFIDGQELTTGFLLKVVVVLVVAFGVFAYYISDVTNRLTEKSRMIWRIIAIAVVLGSVIWGFAVLGSPRTQRLYKYDEQKVSDLMNISYSVESYYNDKAGVLPASIEDLASMDYGGMGFNDPETGSPYEYVKTGDNTYNLCAEFNKDSKEAANPKSYAFIGYQSWTHPAGHYCFSKTVTPFPSTIRK